MGWTEKQLLTENSNDFLNAMVSELNKRNRKNKFK